ncbi:MAG TPA: mechanosensitive ion channel domain-containing protein [Dyella sp.]|nr:mechanosensitive ion channel domain-containing protein [Dyella sp.]
MRHAWDRHSGALPALSISQEDIARYTDQAVQLGIHLVEALVVLLVGIWVARRLANVAERALGRAKFDITLTSFLRNLLYGVLIALLLVYVLQVLRVPSAPLVGALGAAGLAIGLSLQGSLSNLAWGVLLALFRPFRVGDFVDVGGTLGSVDAINLMYTQLVMPDGREAIIPNAKVGGEAIINFNRRGTRRFELTVGIGYKDSIGAAVAEVQKLFAADARILKDPEPGVWTNSLGESSVDLVIRAWTTSDDFWATQTDLLRAIKEAFDAVGISMPFPQRELTVIQGGLPAAAADKPR